MKKSSHFQPSKAITHCLLLFLFFAAKSQIYAQISISVNDTIPTCIGANFKIITTTNAGNGAAFSWKGPNGYVSSEKDATIANLVADGMGVYTVTVSITGQSATATTLVKSNAIEIAVIGGFTNVCVGENLRLRDVIIRNVGEQPLSYAWTGPDGYTSTASATNIPTTEDLRQVGTYTLTETYENGCIVIASLVPTVNKCLSIGNLVWDDTNNDGSNNNGEIGLGNVSVKLYKAKIEGGSPTNNVDGVAIQTTTTNATTGKYLFANLVPGFYIVEIEAPANYKSSVGTNDSPTGIYEPSVSANDDTNNDDDGTSFLGQMIRTSYIELSNFTEPQNDGDTTNGTTADKNSNLTIDFGLHKSECPSVPKCIPFMAKKN
ncbi:SdrD B-like domain-containing protein [Arcicella sp. LKC2W]|uniref:SdrD B-like domain-containing protein n=1 Tax=Arcicella sp. LKC2W TaxID=2984198 RepID=UPI002B2108DC|nr:SdrD B-like domain-containing protein [Arcicella sp. LKC2W]MEA5459002.1 SdrD B-like domain-containing protein [Arcicella sp. LKC2W]